jgi:chemotaxis protein methyltransferase CheR
MSVAAVQQQLQAAKHGDSIEVGPYLTRLCDSLAASMVGDSRSITLKVQAESGMALSNEAVSIGLIVTELVINALKHAFVGNRTSGEIVIRYDVAEPSWRLTVSDNGIGKATANSEKATPGLGTSIVEALAKQLDGHVAITVTQPHGTTVSITHGSFDSELPKAA